VTVESDPFNAASRVNLKPGREVSVQRGHPWIYRGALAEALSRSSGPVEVHSADGNLLGVALPGASGGSLALRMVTFPWEPWNRDTLNSRLARAAELRHRLNIDGDAFRLVHAEGDRLPGLVIDRYADAAVIELFEPAWGPYLETVAQFLVSKEGCRTVLLRLPSRKGAPAALRGAVPASPIVVREGRLRFAVDLVRGQKTGFYLDQRDNRRRFGELAMGRTVLNLFSYSGGFAVAALIGGASSAVNVDASGDAMALARLAYAANGLMAGEGDFVIGDAFEITRGMVASGSRFDAIVVDPPAFVRRKGELVTGLRGYKDINLQALKLLAVGGLLLTCSCSALVGEEELVGAVRAAAVDAHRDLQVLERRGAGPDHPVLLACPQTRHLKALLCRAG